MKKVIELSENNKRVLILLGFVVLFIWGFIIGAIWTVIKTQ